MLTNLTYWILIITSLIAWSILFTLQNLNKAIVSDTEASFLDLHLSISDGFVKTKIFDKRDDFDFDIVNFPFLDGDVPRSSFDILWCLYFSTYSFSSSVQSCR